MNIIYINGDTAELRKSSNQLQSKAENLRVVPVSDIEEIRELLSMQKFHAVLFDLDSTSISRESLQRRFDHELAGLPLISVSSADYQGIDTTIAGDGLHEHILKHDAAADADSIIKAVESLVLKKAEDSTRRLNRQAVNLSRMVYPGSQDGIDQSLAEQACVDSFDVLSGAAPASAFLLLDADGRISAGSTIEKLPGLYPSLSAVMAQRFADLFSGEAHARVKSAVDSAISGKAVSLKVHYPVLNGNQKLWQLHLSCLSQGEASNDLIAVHIEDVTARFKQGGQNHQGDANNQFKLLAKLFEKTIEGVTITDVKGTILQVNPAFTAITGYSSEEAIGKNPRILKSDRHDTSFYTGMWQSLLKRGEWSGEIWNRRSDGEAYPEWLNIMAIKNTAGVTTNYIAIFHDLTEIKQNREQIAFKTYHDSLTGLPNRSFFNSRLRRAIARATRNKSMVSLLVLDIDNFKNINETFGHPAGDELVQQIALRLDDCIQGEDTLARIGGDEFAIFCEDVESLNTTVNLAKSIVSRFKQPFILDDNEVHVSLSIGVTSYPDDGLTESELMKNADMAMYKAKELGKKQFYFFTKNLHQNIIRRLELESSLRRALYNNEFVLHYQPKICGITNKIRGFESLMRWDSPKNGFVSPGEFIPILEEMDFITEVGLWAIEAACNDIKSLNHNSERPYSVAVNLSAKQFEDPWLVKNLESVLKRTRFPSELLTLEITESTIMHNIDNAIEKMGDISALGIPISIDDFGTGYSSLNYLKRFPVSELKIDRSFIMDIPRDQDDVAIARAIVSMARSLELDVVAEGVETKEQLEFLNSLGSMKMQGYYFSKPLPFNRLTDLVAEFHKENQQ